MPNPAITPPNMPSRPGLRYDFTSKVKNLLGEYSNLISDILALGNQVDFHLAEARQAAGKERREVYKAITADAEYMFKRMKRYADLLAAEKITRTNYIDVLGYIKKELNFMVMQLRDLSGEQMVYLSKRK